MEKTQIRLMNPNPKPNIRVECKPRTRFEACTYLYSIAKVLRGDRGRGPAVCVAAVARTRERRKGMNGREWSGPRGDKDSRGRGDHFTSAC